MLRSGRKPQAKAPDAGRTSPATGIPPVFFHKGFDMKRYLIVLAVIAGMLLSACSTSGVREEYDASGKVVAREYSGGDPNYSQYVAAMSRQTDDSASVDASACNGDARCVENVAAFATIRALSGQNRPTIQPPAPKVSGWERFGTAALRTLVPLAGAAVSWHQSDNATETSLAQYGFLGGLVRDVTAASAEVAQAGPSINVGGNYGDTAIDNSQHGDTISDSGNTTITDSNNGDHAGRDIVGRDVIDNSGNYGDDNRQDSPGPIDNSDDGNDCSGSSCNPTEQPEG